jgi:hypothetical protein
MNDDPWGKVIFDTACFLAVVAMFLIVLLVWTSVPPETLEVAR